MELLLFVMRGIGPGGLSLRARRRGRDGLLPFFGTALRGFWDGIIGNVGETK
jgi:hypothetical protein